MLKLRASFISIAAVLWMVHSNIVWGADELVQRPFPGSALTDIQLSAWDYYLAEESSHYGCRYGDDQRLIDLPYETLEALANGDEMPPLQITLRTYLAAGESVRTLLRRNMYIASMECNKVYLFGDDLIGHPVLPFEEFLGILLSKLEQDSSLRNHIGFLRTTKIAAMDVRWFWSFFVLSADHYRLLGYDSNTIIALARALPGAPEVVDEVTALWAIYQKVFSQGLYVNSDNGCDRVLAEPSAEVIVNNSISWSNVSWLYNAEEIQHSGSWRAVVAREAAGYTLGQETAIANPSNPYFNANRRTTILPRECR